MRALKMIYLAQSGHPGASFSLADVMSVLYFHTMRVRPEEPQWPQRDRLVLSKGHAAPILYAALIEKGFLPESAIDTFRKTGGLLQGHPIPKIPGVDATSGSLGGGFSTAVGMAKGIKMRNWDSRVFAIIGDGEQNEGIIWEAAMAAAHFGLDNLIAIADVNGWQNDGPTSKIMQMSPIDKKWEAFGWWVETVDGHDVRQLITVLDRAVSPDCGPRPRMIIAKTIKGRGASYLENDYRTHYVPPTESQMRSAMAELEQSIGGDAR